MHTVNIQDILKDTEVIFPPTCVDLPNITTCIYDKQEAVTALSQGAYRARIARCEAVRFGRLPSGVVAVGHDFWMQYKDHLIKETVPHHVVPNETAFLSAPEAVDVDHECVLLVRFGHGTWGHWLGELLPLAVLTEQRFPGRFRYAVSSEPSGYNQRVVNLSRPMGFLKIGLFDWLRDVHGALIKPTLLRLYGPAPAPIRQS